MYCLISNMSAWPSKITFVIIRYPKLEAQGPRQTMHNIVYRPWWQRMVSTLITELWNSNTISRAILMWHLVFLPLLLWKILRFIQCNVLLLNDTDFDRAIKEPLFCLLYFGIIKSFTCPAFCYCTMYGT